MPICRCFNLIHSTPPNSPLKTGCRKETWVNPSPTAAEKNPPPSPVSQAVTHSKLSPSTFFCLLCATYPLPLRKSRGVNSSSCSPTAQHEHRHPSAPDSTPCSCGSAGKPGCRFNDLLHQPCYNPHYTARAAPLRHLLNGISDCLRYGRSQHRQIKVAFFC